MRALADRLNREIIEKDKDRFDIPSKQEIARAVRETVLKDSAVSFVDIHSALQEGNPINRSRRLFYCPSKSPASGNPFLLEMDDVYIISLEEAVNLKWSPIDKITKRFTYSEDVLPKKYAPTVNGISKVFYRDDDQLRQYIEKRVNLEVTRTFKIGADPSMSL